MDRLIPVDEIVLTNTCSTGGGVVNCRCNEIVLTDQSFVEDGVLTADVHVLFIQDFPLVAIRVVNVNILLFF